MFQQTQKNLSEIVLNIIKKKDGILPVKYNLNVPNPQGRHPVDENSFPFGDTFN